LLVSCVRCGKVACGQHKSGGLGLASPSCKTRVSRLQEGVANLRCRRVLACMHACMQIKWDAGSLSRPFEANCMGQHMVEDWG
jgi:hypothetical protein